MPILRAPRGTRDLLPPERRVFARLERVASELADRYGYRPIETPLFEDGAVVFDSRAGNGRQQAAEEQKIQALEAKVQKKNEVLAELMGEHVELKKKLGVI